MRAAKVRRQTTRIGARRQLTIPDDVLGEAGLREGERVVVRALGPGRLVVERERDILAEYAGSLTGVWEPGALERLRDEWD